MILTAVFFAMAAGLHGQQSVQPRAIEGNPNAAVRVVIYEDLQCPDCADFRKMLDQHLLPKFRSSAAFEHRDFPLAKHSWARKAAIAARYFESLKSEIGLEYRRFAMNQIGKMTPETFNEKLAEFARTHKLDPAKALAALDDPKLADLVERDFQEGIARGIAKTPTVLVDGEPFIERFPLEAITAAIERAVAAAKSAAAK